MQEGIVSGDYLERLFEEPGERERGAASFFFTLNSLAGHDQARLVAGQAASSSDLEDKVSIDWGRDVGYLGLGVTGRREGGVGKAVFYWEDKGDFRINFLGGVM